MVAKTAHELAYEASRVPETITVVSSFLKRNSIPSGEVAGTVRDIHRALLEIAGDAGVFEQSLVQLDTSAAKYLGTPDTSNVTAEDYLPSFRLAALESLGFGAASFPSPALPAPATPQPQPPAATATAADPLPASAPAPRAAVPAPVPATASPAAAPKPVAARPNLRVVPPAEPPAAPTARRPSRSKPRAVPDQPSLFAPDAAPEPKPEPVVARAPGERKAPQPQKAKGTPSPAKPKPTEARAPMPAPAPVEEPAEAPVPAARQAPAPAARPTKAKPFKRVPAEESVQMEFLVCLEDGKKTRDLSRHLYERHSMAPDEYRAKWGLPDSYPMTPPALILRKAELFEFDPITRSLNPVNR